MKNCKLVLMSCCAPCSVAAIKTLKSENYDFMVLFFNPNIFPEQEYQKRLEEQIEFCKKMNVKYEIGDYNHSGWAQEMKGLEAEPERGTRCEKCFNYRFKFGAKWAKEHGFNTITSVFGVSPHKDQKQVNGAAADLGIEYIDLGFDYKPEPGMYRQKYCGCEFSVRSSCHETRN